MMQNTSETQEDVLSSKAIEYLEKQRPKINLVRKTWRAKDRGQSLYSDWQIFDRHGAMKVIIPARFDTLEATMFLGLNKETASIIHAHVMRYPEALHILSSAVEWMEDLCGDCESAEDDWLRTMQRAGIRDDIAQANMRPEHDIVRYIQPLWKWLAEIFEAFYDALETLDARVLERYESRADLRGEDEEYRVPSTLDGHKALFNSVSAHHITNVMRKNADRSLNLGWLRSGLNTDFSTWEGALYFTDSLWVTRSYSRLIEDTCHFADHRTVEIHVPLLHFTEVKTWDLRFCDTWKHLVWHSRRCDKLPETFLGRSATMGALLSRLRVRPPSVSINFLVRLIWSHHFIL
jgi:hypothetical protein